MVKPYSLHFSSIWGLLLYMFILSCLQVDSLQISFTTKSGSSVECACWSSIIFWEFFLSQHIEKNQMVLEVLFWLLTYRFLLLHLISSYHMGTELLQTDSRGDESVLKNLWQHQDAILCCSLKVWILLSCKQHVTVSKKILYVVLRWNMNIYVKKKCINLVNPRWRQICSKVNLMTLINIRIRKSWTRILEISPT